MPSISKDDKTITWMSPAEDEAQARIDLQELLDANPGYTPVLIVEDAAGEETTYTSLEAPARQQSPASVSEPVDEEAEGEGGDTEC